MSPDPAPEFEAEILDDRAILRGPGLGIAFRRHGDRWTDAIVGPGPTDEVARAQFATSADEDPARVAHPVFQELQLHGPAAGPSLCLLLTGLSFDHHFSAAVTLAHDPAGIVLDLDVADRCRSPVESLAATYLVALDSGSIATAEPARITWDIAEPVPGRLEFIAGPDTSIAMAEAGRSAMRVQVLATIRPGTFTHRLRYGWRWTSADGPTR